MEILSNQSLKDLNTFGIDAIGRRFCRFKNTEDIQRLFDLDPSSETLLILGGGSNVLFVTDFDGLIARNEILGIDILDRYDNHIWLKVGAGVVWHELVKYCVENNYGGIENLSLIPGTVGAAPMQNIGAYGVELKEVFHELEAFKRSNGEIEVFTNKDCEFGYRESIFKTIARDKYIITSVTLRLSTKEHHLNTEYGAIQDILTDWGVEQPSIRDISNVVMSIRRSKLPDPAEIGNAGSFFKNPVIDKIDFEGLKLEFPNIQGYEVGPDQIKVPAGWLIDQCGWKGKRFGNIGVHKNQALVLVNYGGGKGKEILSLAREIQASVANTYGIELQPEVNLIQTGLN